MSVLEQLPILSVLIWMPIIGAILVLMTGDDAQAGRARAIALGVSLASVLLCIPLYWHFNPHTSAMQFTELHTWIPAYGIDYRLGIDGISLPMILLSSFTTLVVVLASFNAIKTKVAQYMAAFLIMQGMMVGVFAALDAVLFYVFWEGMLIPMYICIGVWGGENRTYASIKFFLYTFLGSAFMFVALLYLRSQSGSFNILDYYPLHLTEVQQVWLFLAFLAAFAVKVPMWPFHTWLPDAHTEAPAGGSVVLAALMLKLGIYGFLRFNLPITPNASASLFWLMIVLSLIAIVYVALVAIAQTDMKKLIAYSSISHMGFATLGCYMVYEIIAITGNHQDAYLSMEGGLVQMVSHAFSSGAMFFGVGVLYDRMHTRLINDYGGVATKMPVFTALFVLFAMSNIGLPGTAGFVGEFMVIISAFKANFVVAFLAATTLILGAVYTLWMVKRVFYGPVTQPAVAQLSDINGIDRWVFGLLAAGVLLIGLYPECLLRLFHASVGHLLDLSLANKL